MPRRGRSANRVRGEELRVRCGESLIEPDSRDLVGGRILLEEGTDLLSCSRQAVVAGELGLSGLAAAGA